MNAFKPAFRPAIRPAITSVFGVKNEVVVPLSFVTQPQSKTVNENALATFSCEVTGGVAPYSYQWKKNGTNVGANSAALSFTAAASDKNASISVTVIDSAGAVITSDVAVLGVNLQLAFVSQPQAKTVEEYSLATFSCEVTGGVAPYTYQWKKNGTNVGTNSASLSFTAAAADKNASITVVVTDSVGTAITSTVAVLGVTSYAFNFDGLTQYVQLSSEVVLNGDFDVSFVYKGLAADYKTFIAAANNDRFARFDANGTARMYCGYATPTSTTKVTDNVPRTIRFRRVGQVSSVYVNGVLEGSVDNSISLGTVKLSKLMEASGSYAKGALSKLTVESAGVQVLNLPLNNKSQGANQLATAGSINATIINYNAAGWTAI